MLRCFLLIVAGLVATQGSAQRLLGLVYEKTIQGTDQPLVGANVFWLGTTVGTTTRANGTFFIDRVDMSNRLVISYVGYRADTLLITDQTQVRVELQPDVMLNEVVVEGWRPTTRIDSRAGIGTQTMDERELFKAACCNLSESFETNPAVDVAFTDALTGTRQIQMLGLAGANTMISLENMPGVRGLAASQGIQFIPGTWIQSIQVTKGVGSVVNGYESIAGQINVELKKPEDSEVLYINGYANNAGRLEANLITTAQVSKKWATTVLLHSSARPVEMDQNQDGFLDFPLGTQLNAINRWVYHSGTGWLGQFSFRYLRDRKQGGQTGFDEANRLTTNRYGLEVNTDRYEWTGKLGYQFPGKPYKSFGIQSSLLAHQHRSYIGLTEHTGYERSLYLNFIYQSIIGHTDHKFKLGASYLLDVFDEQLAYRFWGDQFVFDRTERVPGMFGEYTYETERMSVVAGLRADYHNLFGWLVTPRLHTRFQVIPGGTLRLSAGRGLRVANVVTENIAALATSRRLQWQPVLNAAYGFRPDQAWNYGASGHYDFDWRGRPGALSFDYFFTDFQSQVVVDYDRDPRAVHLYALAGRSYSHSTQVQLDYQPWRRWDVRLAFRFLDVQTDFSQGRLQRPLIPRTRAFVNIAYATRNNWKFDLTVQRLGQQRIPGTLTNPPEFQLPATASGYGLVNAQITKDFTPRWSVYLGIENATNFRLDNPIIDATDPFGPYFDSSLIWGPVFGRMLYTGFRYRIQ